MISREASGIPVSQIPSVSSIGHQYEPIIMEKVQTETEFFKKECESYELAVSTIPSKELVAELEINHKESLNRHSKSETSVHSQAKSQNSVISEKSSHHSESKLGNLVNYVDCTPKKEFKQQHQ